VLRGERRQGAGNGQRTLIMATAAAIQFFAIVAIEGRARRESGGPLKLCPVTAVVSNSDNHVRPVA
jgi:hypothetical protein